MIEQVLVQLLADKSDSYRWGIVDGLGQWQERPFSGDKTALLASLQSIDLPIMLVIPGEKVVVTRMYYNPAEKRHFRQLLPYQLEEQIIGDVEDLHFATGPLIAGEVIVAYVDSTWFAETITWYRDRGFTISRCVTDFQLLRSVANQCVVWLTGSRVLCLHGSGLGFSTDRSVLQPLLAGMFSEVQAHNTDIQLYGDSESALDYLIECLPDTMRQQATQCSGEPVLDLLGSNGIDLCQGPYANKLPLSHWWRALRASTILAAAALLAFVAVNALEVFQLKAHQRLVKQQIEQRYRQVIPKGAMGDAVKQLQRKLGTTDTDTGKSQVVYLLSAVAPAIKAQKINITTLAYNAGSGELNLNIEAKAFNVVEKLRKQLQDNGLQAQLKRSDSSDDTVRARLQISMAEG